MITARSVEESKLKGRRALPFMICVTFLALAPKIAEGQAPTEIHGVVLDSLHNERLAGAQVAYVTGEQLTLKTVLTDSSGQFSIPEAAPGEYAFTVQHPVLDSTGIVLQGKVSARAGVTSKVVLAIPSSQTLQRMYCGTDTTGSFVLGRVMRGTHQNPAERAHVTLDWYSIGADAKRGVVSEYSSRSATTSAWGHYAFCGLPADFEASVSAATDSSATPRVSFAASNRVALLPWLFLPDAGFPPSTVSGRVLNGTTPLEGVTIEVLGLPLQARSDATGSFHLPMPVTGTTLIRARKIGYTASVLPINVTADADEPLTINLEKPGTSLQTIVVRERMNSVISRSGFDQRARRGIGSYIDAAEIQRSKTTCVVDFIRRRTGAVRRGRGCSTVSASDVGTKYGFGFRGIETLRNRLPSPPTGEADAPKPKYQSTQLGVNIVVDGFLETPEFKTGEVDLAWLDAKDVVGIEVYADTRGGVSIWIWTTAYNGINRGLTRPAQ